jgi:quercetin dioxygenase-like cupin family protein
MTNRITQPTHAAKTVDYQDGAVVSQVVFRSESGTITAFAFAEGEGLSEHSNPNDATVLALEGSVDMTIGNEEHRLEQGDMLHLPPDVPHALHGGEPFKIMLTILKRTQDAEGPAERSS